MKKSIALIVASAMLASMSLVSCGADTETTSNEATSNISEDTQTTSESESSDVTTTSEADNNTSETKTTTTETSEVSTTENSTASGEESYTDDLSKFNGLFKINYDETEDHFALIDEAYIYVNGDRIVEIYNMHSKIKFTDDSTADVVMNVNGEEVTDETVEYKWVDTSNGKSKHIIDAEGFNCLVTDSNDLYMVAAGEYIINGTEYRIKGDYDLEDADEYTADIKRIDDDTFKMLPHNKGKELSASLTRITDMNELLSALEESYKDVPVEQVYKVNNME